MDKETEVLVTIWRLAIKNRLLKVKLKGERMISIKEIREMIVDSKNYHELSKQEKEQFDLVDHSFQGQSINDYLESVIQTLLQWNYYIIYLEGEQEFELCNSIQEIIELEMEDAFRILETYFTYSTFYRHSLRNLPSTCRARSVESYDEWINLINK